jgi:hypothetical protein
MIYEIDYTRHHPENGHHEIIAILTGLPIEEIHAVASDKQVWHSRMYVQAFKQLGFNVNPRFVKWDHTTPYPCMMRFKRIDIKESYWHALAYNNGKVYPGNGEWWLLESFTNANPHLRITSMLQVWI